MLSRAVLHFKRSGRGGQSSRDIRSVEEVVANAVASLGATASTDCAAIVETMHKMECFWAWQLAEADINDWSKIGTSVGFKLAIKSELTDPSAPVIDSEPEPGMALDAGSPADELLRRFLLLSLIHI